jgi:hypothetical protein
MRARGQTFRRGFPALELNSHDPSTGRGSSVVGMSPHARPPFANLASNGYLVPQRDRPPRRYGRIPLFAFRHWFQAWTPCSRRARSSSESMPIRPNKSEATTKCHLPSVVRQPCLYLLTYRNYEITIFMLANGGRAGANIPPHYRGLPPEAPTAPQTHDAPRGRARYTTTPGKRSTGAGKDRSNPKPPDARSDAAARRPPPDAGAPVRPWTRLAVPARPQTLEPQRVEKSCPDQLPRIRSGSTSSAPLE